MAENFETLEAWRSAKELCLLCYKFSKKFPREEMYGLGNQLQRAGVSVPSNIAEGYSRRTRREISRFLDIALGSVFEILTQIDIALELGYINKTEKELIFSVAYKTIRLINGFKKYRRTYGPES
jgi:four helix bundle protein